MHIIKAFTYIVLPISLIGVVSGTSSGTSSYSSSLSPSDNLSKLSQNIGSPEGQWILVETLSGRERISNDNYQILTFVGQVYQKKFRLCIEDSNPNDSIPPPPCVEDFWYGRYIQNGDIIQVTVEGGPSSTAPYPYTCRYKLDRNNRLTLLQSVCGRGLVYERLVRSR